MRPLGVGNDVTLWLCCSEPQCPAPSGAAIRRSHLRISHSQQSHTQTWGKPKGYSGTFAAENPSVLIATQTHVRQWVERTVNANASLGSRTGDSRDAGWREGCPLSPTVTLPGHHPPLQLTEDSRSWHDMFLSKLSPFHLPSGHK